MNTPSNDAPVSPRPTAAQLGYCTNVHAGDTLPQMRANLQQYAVAVKSRFRPERPMGIGLWLGASAARSLIEEGEIDSFAHWLAESGLLPFTLNGFPYGDFHQDVVKHQVYLPDWAERERLEYTTNLATIHAGLLPEGTAGSISTLPVAWGTPQPDAAMREQSARQLAVAARFLSELQQRTGRFICLCIEPEPGCLIETSEGLVRFYEDYLLKQGDERLLRRHVQVCHDVCHAAVMFEDQQDVLDRYRSAGIGVGKVQVSSAICLSLDALQVAQQQAAIEQLADFQEDRYLHQTMVKESPTQAARFYEDLPLALAAARERVPSQGQWRVHFHVPIYLHRFGLLETTQGQILECLTALEGAPQHFEVETYAWGVLPEEMRQPDLAHGIADELAWFDDMLSCHP